eukprot:TRINITY_DN1203_c0_g1_i1.p2 TRINITY_DN1203_c0_g1~~TRINITY_DN1203_c0_g1_i1.p2  ORF type:complete len:162 (+),score=43.94 TRINITY_DN1203_c0_g1_i1:70-486(+)
MSADSLASKKNEWSACLAKEGLSGRCKKLEQELRSMDGQKKCCVDETIALMQCTGSSGRAAGCSQAFLAMRECNRAGGRELVADGAGYAVAPGKQGVFDSATANLVASAPPVRTLEGMVSFGADYAQSLGIAPGQVRF